jgi:hypothetical protein
MNTLRISSIIAALLLSGIIGIQAQTTNKPREKGAVVYDLPRMDDVIIKRNIPYQDIGGSPLKMDIYYPPDFTVMMPDYYSLIHENELAFKYLDNAEIRGFINYPWLSEIDPFLENIRGEERFKKLMERVKYEWENFEV